MYSMYTSNRSCKAGKQIPFVPQYYQIQCRVYVYLGFKVIPLLTNIRKHQKNILKERK